MGCSLDSGPHEKAKMTSEFQLNELFPESMRQIRIYDMDMDI